MFKNYVATEADLAAIEAGIGACWREELKTVFTNKALLAQVLVLSYDSRYVYLWVADGNPYQNVQAGLISCRLAGYHAYKAVHRLNISDEVQRYWRVGLLPKRLESVVRKLLAEPPDLPIVSGGLQAPLIALQERKRLPANPYTSLAGYKATIVHELAHQYFDQHNSWRFSSKRQNLCYLKAAMALYRGRSRFLPRLALRVPNYGVRHTLLSEAFAFSAEYAAARRLWPNHQAALDRNNGLWMDNLIVREKKASLDHDDSVLDLLPGHAFAVVVGRLISEQSPRTWAKRLLASNTLC